MAIQKSIIGLVKVDRGIINIGTTAQGKHIAYYAGLVISNNKTGKIEFLDDYNAWILLREYFKCDLTGIASQSLQQIIEFKRDFLNTQLSTICVVDLDTYLKANQIEVLPRNAANMRMMAQRMD